MCILFELLVRGKEVALQESTTSVYFFTSQGVYRTKPNQFEPLDGLVLPIVQRSTFLLDLDQDSKAMPEAWLALFPSSVWASSPNQSRWKLMHKQYDSEKWIMAPWTSEEISAQRFVGFLALH